MSAPPTYLVAFRQWRDAPINERDQVARDAVRRYLVRELFPLPPDGRADERIADMQAGDGKTFAGCSDKERGVWVAWLRAVVAAAENRAAAINLHAAFQALGRRL